MKKTVALAILGIGAATSAFAQGHIVVWNYAVSPYNQVVWDATVPTVGGTAVLDTDVQLTFWVGQGVVSDPNSLVASLSPAFTVDALNTYNPGAGFGGGGYYSAQDVLTPGTGTFTVQIRASGTTTYGDVTGESALFQIDAVPVANPAGTAPISPGLTVSVVPEPTTFALAGLGAAALLIFRRRD